MYEEYQKEDQSTYTYHFYFNHGLFEAILHLRDFINSIDQSLAETLKLKMQEEKVSDFFDTRFNPEVQYGIIFPDILWRTTFLHSYFLLESSLDQICQNVKVAEGFSISLQDMKGAGIHRASLYLKKVAKVTIPFRSEAWNAINDFNKIRNSFVHADGYVHLSNKDFIGFAKRYSGLSIEEFGNESCSLTLSKAFALESLQAIEKFFLDIYKYIQPGNIK